MERKYTDMTSLDAFPSNAIYPTKVACLFVIVPLITIIGVHVLYKFLKLQKFIYKNIETKIAQFKETKLLLNKFPPPFSFVWRHVAQWRGVRLYMKQNI